MSISLNEVLSPLPEAQFFSDFWNIAFTHIAGGPAKFDSLFSWEELNRILEEHRLPPTRLRMVRNGRSIDPNTYLGKNDFRLKADGLLSQIDAGATLIINYVDEVSRPLRDFVAGLEKIFRTSINVNLYAGWRTDNGFAVHFDYNDSLILQVHGSKHWKIWRPTRSHPLQSDTEVAPKPTEAPVWDENLKQGSLLFIPRGWWHVATPLNEPCLHLTITINSQCGMELMEWLVKELQSDSCARSNVPVFGTPEQKRQYVQHLVNRLTSNITPDLLDRYFASYEKTNIWRPELNLPAVPQKQAIAAA
jgi:ribosomal protein L16 Arg81 hydroxylase